MIGLAPDRVPELADVNRRLAARTGWAAVGVGGFIPAAQFFRCLSRRRFPTTLAVRPRAQLDYLPEPDIFHDVFGHVPLHADPVFADYLAAYGRGGQRALGLEALKYLGRLYWYTVEFGLIAEPEGLRIYGSGIVSSYAESQFALDDPSPNRIGFDLARVMRTEYRIDDFQQNYFVIPSFDELLRVTVETDFAPLYETLKAQPDIPIAEILPEDHVITRGTQDYARGKGPAVVG